MTRYTTGLKSENMNRYTTGLKAENRKRYKACTKGLKSENGKRYNGTKIGKQLEEGQSVSYKISDRKRAVTQNALSNAAFFYEILQHGS